MGQNYGDAVAREGSVWVENVFEGLDEPGEWVLDSKKGKLYLWPLSDEPENITAPSLTELIRVEGVIDYNGPSDKPVKNIVFDGLTFTCGDRFKWEKDRKGWQLQHDWEMFDRPTALVRFRGAENCVVENCHFSNTGGAAIRLDLYAQKNTITNNLIEHVGGAGILLAGYGPGTKNVNKQNKIFNNYIHHAGQILWHSAAVFAWQSGENLISNNLIHDMPYAAIAATGRILWDRNGKGECSKTIRWAEVDKVLGENSKTPSWEKREPFLHSRKNIIEKNNIYRVMKRLGDGNAIYVSGAGAGNVVRQNYIHDNNSQSMGAAIRCDDDQPETIIEDNIIYRNEGAGDGIIIKAKNTIANNIIANLSSNIGRQRGYIVFPWGPIAGAVIEHNICYANQAGLILYWQGKSKEVSDTWLRDTKADYNIYYNAADPNWGSSHIQRENNMG